MRSSIQQVGFTAILNRKPCCPTTVNPLQTRLVFPTGQWVTRMQTNEHAVELSCGGIPEGTTVMTARGPMPEIVAGDTSVVLVVDGLRCTGGGSSQDDANVTLKQYNE